MRISKPNENTALDAAMTLLFSYRKSLARREREAVEKLEKRQKTIRISQEDE